MLSPTIDPNAQRFFGAAPAQRKSELDMNTFIRLLTVQLANQNPLEPMNDRDFFAQMAQLGQVQGTERMQKQLEVMQASSLIGKTVRANIARVDGAPMEQVIGRVIGMDVKNGDQILKVQEADGGFVDVKFENVLSFTDIQVQQPPVPTLAEASLLIGREVKITDPSTNPATTVEGRVIRASMQNGAPMVTIEAADGTVRTLRYSNVLEVLS